MDTNLSGHLKPSDRLIRQEKDLFEGSIDCDIKVRLDRLGIGCLKIEFFLQVRNQSLEKLDQWSWTPLTRE